MDQTSMKVILEFKKALFKQGLTIEKIVVFGSHAKGNQREDSDIDVAVISDSFAGKDLWERASILGKAVVSIQEPIEAVGYTLEEWQHEISPLVRIAKAGIPFE
ncbi:MAG: nucleotidyltransferase domain-containing protein [Calditrichaeota bacterium]|nr:nucleotidyltransferase domain-containing protein [Calditrichota bacterium]